MAAIDDFYKALVDRFGTVEVSPTIAIGLDPQIWHGGAAEGVTANDVAAALPSTYALREARGFEIRARPLLVFQLSGKTEGRQTLYFSEMCARLDADLVPVT